MYFPALAKHNCEAIKCRACDSSSYKSATTKIAVWELMSEKSKERSPHFHKCNYTFSLHKSYVRCSLDFINVK